MGYNKDDFQMNDGGDELLNRFERSMHKKRKTYFDIDDFEEIADKYLLLNLPELALKALEEGLLQHPGNINLFYLKSQAFLDLNKPDEALQIIELLKNTDLDNSFLTILEGSAVLQMNDHIKAESLFNKALENIEDENKYEALNLIADNYFDSELYLQAGKYFKEALQFEPQNQDILFNLAICCENSFDFSNAINYFNAYLNIEPYDALVWFYVGNLYGKTGQLKKSIEAMDFCVAINETFDLAYFQKAFTLYIEHRYDEALQSFLKFMGFKNESYLAYYYVAMCYKEKNNFVEAKKYFLKTIETDRRFNNKSSEPFFCIGQMYEINRKFNLALKYYSKGIELDPFYQRNWIGMGSVYIKVGLIDLANKYFKRGLAIDPGNSESYDLILKSLIIGKQWSRVVKLAKSGLNSLGEINTLRIYYAIGLIKTGKHKMALKTCPYVFNDNVLFGKMLEISQDESLRKYQQNLK